MKNEISSYDRIWALIERCVRPVSPVKFQDCNRMLVIAVNSEEWLWEGMKTILESNSGMEFIIVAQTRMKDVLDQLYQGRYKTVYWSGRYTLEVLEKVRDETTIEEIDAFLFFPKLSTDLRDKNLYQIGEMLKKEKPDIHIFSNTTDQVFYEYYDISLYNQALRAYEEMDRLIEMELSCAERGFDV